MTFLGKARKIDLTEVAVELGEEVPPDTKLIDLKNIIVNSKNYEEQFVKDMLDRIISERLQKDKENAEMIERDKQRAYELEKLKIEVTNRVSENVNVVSDQHKNSQKEFYKLMHKYNLNEGDISFYLVLFERQARRVDLEEQYWVSYLLGLLPYELTQLIAREPEEKANDYKHVKELLLKRLKLTPEQFRLKFVQHVRAPRSTWKDFAYELRNYLDEWITGLKIEDFETLKELIIADQLKKKVPLVIREHFVDDWVQLNNSEKLAQKLDEYESVRAGMRTLSVENKTFKYMPKPKFNAINDPSNSQYWNLRNSNEVSKMESNAKLTSRNNAESVNKYVKDKFYGAEERKGGYNMPIRNEKGQPKCYNCNYYGHISRDCLQPKKAIICKKCNMEGHSMKACTLVKSDAINPSNLSVTQNANDSSTVYRKQAKLNGSDKVYCIIDTGSSVCLLKNSVAKKLNILVEPHISELYGFGNQNEPASTTLGKTIVDIEIDGVEGKKVTVFIVGDDTQPCDLLVGRTWIDLPHIAYARIGSVLKLGYADDDLFLQLRRDINAVQRIKLETVQAVEIEKNTISLVKAKTAELNNGFVLFTGIEENVDSLIKVVNGETNVPVMCLGNSNVTLRENQCIGRVEVVKEEEWLISEKDVLYNENETKNSEFSVNIIHEKRPIILEEIKFDESLTNDKRQDILQLLNEYRDCFALNMKELGCTDVCKMDIKEIEGSKPISQRPYKTSAEERRIIKEIVDEWRANGIVTDTKSPYASPVLLVKKKTGEHRLVVDYRRLNSQTVRDKFPLPRIDDLLECLSECKLFTTLDLAHGYLQIPLTEEAKLKTAFITADDTGQFQRMIFGLANAPSEFQRLMNHVLSPLLNTRALCYLDDILIPAKSWSEMMERLREVFECLRTAKLTLKLPKCEFGKTEVEFLGFVVNANGLKPGPRKVKAIENFPEPQNVHDVRRFLGLTGYFRRFVTNYAQKAEPLSRLTKKDVKFEWNENQNNAFVMLKGNLVSQPILAHYNQEAETEVHCDASSDGIAGMLLQKGEDNKWHLVYCVSKKTTDAERKYHSSKLELMAIVWTLDRLRQLLIGIKFTVVTDCQALVYMNAKKTLNPQISRWYNLIQEYDFEIRHKSGEKMAHVDALSRAPESDSEDTLCAIAERNLEVCLTLTEDEQILMIQYSDTELRKLIDIFRKEACKRSTAENQMIENYVFKRNRLYRKVQEGEEERLLYVIPKCMRKSTVVKFHDLMGHFSVDKTVNKIRELYWFPSMKRYVRRHISMCFECLLYKVPGGKHQGFLHPIKPGKRPFSILHIDHLGPFVKSSRGNQELLVIIDNLTRFVRLNAVRNTSAQNVLKVLGNFVNEFGLPDRIISDRGSCFTSRQFEDYCRENGIKHTLNSTKHPQANGMVERVNRTILPVIATCMEDQRHRDWDVRIKEVEKNLNNVVNKTTNKTPFEMLHGYKPRYNDGLLRKLADEDACSWKDPSEIQEETRKIIDAKQTMMKKNYDKKRCRTLIFERGEIVVMRQTPKVSGQPTKTQPKYRGPLIITEVLPGDTYRVTQLEEKERGHLYTTTAHVSQLKPWKCNAESSEDEDQSEDTQDDSLEDTPRRNPRRSAGRPKHYGR